MSSPRNSNPTNPWRQKHPVPTAASAKIDTSHKPLERKHSSGSCCWYFNSSAFVLCAPKANVSQKLFVGTLFGKLVSWKKFGTRIVLCVCYQGQKKSALELARKSFSSSSRQSMEDSTHVKKTCSLIKLSSLLH